MPAAITAAMARPLVRASKERPISSMPKTIPASGVLKAAATPAEAPARISPGCRRGETRPIANINEAPTCTVGPSRPTEAPQSRPSTVNSTLPTAILTETSRLRAARSGNWRAAMAWGMPLPWLLAKKRRAR